MTSSVTVSITRHVDPEQADRMVAWINAGASLAERFEGFLGTGWVRPSMDSHQWHMLYRFDSDAALDRWEDSDQRRWWLASAQGIVGESVVERRTGIEGWFDDPVSTDVADLRPGPPAPPRVLLSTQIMTYVALPTLTSWMSWWLQGESPPWRKDR